jgi:hypothetical protein
VVEEGKERRGGKGGEFGNEDFADVHETIEPSGGVRGVHDTNAEAPTGRGKGKGERGEGLWGGKTPVHRRYKKHGTLLTRSAQEGGRGHPWGAWRVETTPL